MESETESKLKLLKHKAEYRSMSGVNLDDTCRRKVKLDCPMYSKQTNLKRVYSWNKMWLLKSLAMLKCESRTSLHTVQYK